MSSDLSYRQRIDHKLRAAFAPEVLDIQDDSASHAGHAGHHALGETHFSVHIVSAAFQELSRVERHRQVYAILADEIKERVHALSLHVLTPDESTKG